MVESAVKYPQCEGGTSFLDFHLLYVLLGPAHEWQPTGRVRICKSTSPDGRYERRIEQRCRYCPTTTEVVATLPTEIISAIDRYR